MLIRLFNHFSGKCPFNNQYDTQIYADSEFSAFQTITHRETTMTISIESAARFVAECSGWKATNLIIQKILYIAQVVHLGRTGQKLIDAEFEAWDYGPVAPDLYHQIKGFGSKPIPESVLWSAKKVPEGLELDTLKEACEHLVGKTGGDLIRNTHWSGGAWVRRYVPGRNTKISTEDMLDEFKNRTSRKGD